MPLLNSDRLFPESKIAMSLARDLYQSIAKLPIISPHGHCDPSWFSENQRFPDPAQLFVLPDHYILRMLVSNGLTLNELGLSPFDDSKFEKDPRKIWRKFSENYYLFRGTPTALWLDYSFEKVFELSEPLMPENSDFYFDHIEKKLAQDEYLPRALFDQFKIEVLATTDHALSTLSHHADIIDIAWNGKIIPTYRPDGVIDPEVDGFKENLVRFGNLTGENTQSWDGYLNAHRSRRLFFKKMGATATDHGHP